MSGAGRVKNDGHDDKQEYEIKLANKQYTVQAEDISKLIVNAARVGRVPKMLVYFDSIDVTAEIQFHHGKGIEPS